MKIQYSLFIILFLGLIKLQAQDPNDLLLRNYRPESIYKIPETNISKAAFHVIDMHTHDFAETPQEIEFWVKTMDDFGIKKSIVLTYQTGPAFDSIVEKYSKYKDRFELWCGFDYTGYDTPGFGPNAVKEIERCFKMGARGIGELGDKGLGEFYSKPVPGWGMHIDDPRLKPLFAKCAELNMPINVHVAEPIWMYAEMDSTNDGLMCAFNWKVDMTKPGIIGFEDLMTTLENALRENPKTTFITCHFANCMHDLSILSKLLDKYSNLYADISARYAETATIPRYMKGFFEKYQDRLFYGTDMGFDPEMYRATFRILETDDEHFYAIDQFEYHWALSGFGLPSEILEKLYYKNAEKILTP